MPRRPRPAHRPPPKSAVNRAPVLSSPPSSIKSGNHVKQPRPKAVDFFQSDSDTGRSEDDSEEASEEDASQSGDDSDSARSRGEASDEVGEEEDLDAPRVAQWIDDEDLNAEVEGSDLEEDELESDEDEDEDVVPSAGPSRATLQSLEDDLSTMPLGMLRNAQRALAQAQALSDSGSETDAPSEEDAHTGNDIRPHSTSSKGKEKERAETAPKHRRELAKRSSKHAPMEATSKKPVTRRRTVVEVKTAQPRDPRFLPIAGEFAPHKFRQQYGFLSDLHTNELKALRENLKRARKLLANSPKDQRVEREQEVARLELAMKRGESSVNRDKREKIEAEALGKVAKEEREKRKQGKAGWWMKGSDKKELLTKARYEAIANAGGKRAVKKAIEKKEKKISQKEKKSRPFARGQSTETRGGVQKRPARFGSGGDGDRNPKRRKLA
ncbi:DUF947-domain-containing protein [Leucogyrophana mollusca]|uniref:DUF947-domain-containing protein n=1 Tax=Leucogyrophana mollusca TaxID=85980 RepID=A0ACB8B964_9AGAM|nr:DUF947-domain-containing protein [Leucogyrophana mollusca]